MNTALNRTSIALLTNKSGGSVVQGDVVVIDSANAAAFTTTTTSSYVSGSIGVVLEPNGIASNAIGLVAFGGYVPLINLSTSASLGDVFHAHSVAKQALRHAVPIVGGDFGQVLGTGTTPAALLWGQPSAPASAVSLTTAENKLAADVNLTTGSTVYDGPSVSLAAGTWFLVGHIEIYAGTSATQFTGKLWDGTTVFDSAEETGAISERLQLSFVGLVSPGSTTTYKISVTPNINTTGALMQAATNENGAGNNASHLVGVKVA